MLNETRFLRDVINHLENQRDEIVKKLSNLRYMNRTCPSNPLKIQKDIRKFAKKYNEISDKLIDLRRLVSILKCKSKGFRSWK